MIFISVVIILGVYYSNLQTDIYEQYSLNEMHRKAISVSDTLVRTSGNPEFWNPSNVKVIGLFDSGKLNITKFEQLKTMSYDIVKSMLGVGNYDLYLSVKNESGQLIESGGITYSFGSDLSNVKKAILIKRLGISEIEGEVKKIILEVILWIKEV